MWWIGLAAAEDFDGAVPVDDGVDYFGVEFEVPEGTAEIEVEHAASEGDILDFGLLDPEGFRGWGGGNTEAAVVGTDAASRSYLPGALPAGTWRVLVGEARLESSAPSYAISVTLRPTATLVPDERAPWVDEAQGGAGWYAGDLHVHSEDSGDAEPSLDEIASFAEGRGLDFVVITDHNTHAQVGRLAPAQARWPGFLFVPGVEFTTYAGHANAFGATDHVWHTLGWEGHDLAEATAAFADQGALFSINHPALDLGELCIGCAWENEIPPLGELHAVEIQTGAWSVTGELFGPEAVAFWESLLDQGHHLAAVGGSDDHRAGQGTGVFDSAIGSPTTMIRAESLSTEGLLQGIRDSRTVVKLEGPDAPMIELDTSPPREGDTVRAAEVRLSVRLTGADGMSWRWVHDGVAEAAEPVEGDPFLAERVVVPAGDRWRVEVLDGDRPLSLSSYVWLEAEAEPPPDEDCGCGGAASLLLLAGLGRRRR